MINFSRSIFEKFEIKRISLSFESDSRCRLYLRSSGGGSMWMVLIGFCRSEAPRTRTFFGSVKDTELYGSIHRMVFGGTRRRHHLFPPAAMTSSDLIMFLLPPFTLPFMSSDNIGPGSSRISFSDMEIIRV